MHTPAPVYRNVGCYVTRPADLTAAAITSLDVTAVVELVCALVLAAHARQPGLATPATVDRYVLMLRRFAAYANAAGAGTVEDVNADLVGDFVFAWSSVKPGGSRRKDLAEPSGGTQSVRRAALRVLHSALLTCGLPVPDWTAGIVLEGRVAVRRLPVLPLTPPQVAAVLHAAECRSGGTRRAALVAVSAGGVAPYETGLLTPADFAEDATAVAVHGGPVSRYRARTVPLREWQAQVVLAHLSSGVAHDLPLLYPNPTGTPSLVSAYQGESLMRAYRLAGITGVRASALWLYAANVTYALAGVEAVRERLGLAKLDTAFGLIHPGWQETWAEVARTQGGV